jgi:hypothetical protein
VKTDNVWRIIKINSTVRNGLYLKAAQKEKNVSEKAV